MDGSHRALRAVAVLTAVLILLIGEGCFTRTVYVPSGKTVRLRQDIKEAKIWAKDSEGKLTPGVLDLKEGWFIGPNENPLPIPPLNPQP
jgi:hypothetical protein